MNGKRFFLDTNSIIQLLKGNADLLNILSQSDYIACSIVSILEYLAFPGLSAQDINLFHNFIKKIETIELTLLDKDLIDKILDTRRHYRLKLPDAIIVGSSEVNNCILITADKQILNIKGIDSLSYTLI